MKFRHGRVLLAAGFSLMSAYSAAQYGNPSRGGNSNSSMEKIDVGGGNTGYTTGKPNMSGHSSGNPSTGKPNTSGYSSGGPTSGHSSGNPSTGKPSTSGYSSGGPTSGHSSGNPSTGKPSTSGYSSGGPTSGHSSGNPSTGKPSTSGYSSGGPTSGHSSGNPSTGKPSTSGYSSGGPTSGHSSGNPSTGKPSTSGYTDYTGGHSSGNPSTGKPSTTGYTTGHQSTGKPSTTGYTTGHQSTGKPSTSGYTDYTTGHQSTGKPSTTGYTTGHQNTTGHYNSTGKPSTTGYTTGHQNTTGHQSTGKPSTTGYTTGHQNTTGHYNTTGHQNTTGRPTTSSYTTGHHSTGYTTSYNTTTVTPTTTTVTPTTTTEQPTTTTDIPTTTTVTPTTTTETPTTTTETPTTTTETPTTTTEQPTTTTETPTSTTENPTTSTATTSTSTTGEETSSTTMAEETSSTTGTDSTSSTTGEEEKKKKLRWKLEPLFHLRFDFGTYIVNLTPHGGGPKAEDYKNNSRGNSTLVKYDYQPSGDTLIKGDYRDGFQKTVYGSLEVGLGAQVRFWYENAHGLADQFWAYVGVLPLVGRDVASVRYAKDLSTAQRMGGRWSVPSNASDLDRWDEGDSITYAGHGGVLFLGGVGFGPVGVGATRLANGTWETYVEKVGSHRAYVKMTRGKIRSYSAFMNVSIISLAVSTFGNSDDGFSYLFDLSTDEGRKGYEDMIRGNVVAASDLASAQPKNLVELAPVTKVESFRTVSTGKMISKSMSIPIIWDHSYSTSKVASFSTSDLHVERNTARVNYGIYTEAEDNRFWFKHANKDYMFYGAAYSAENWDTKEVMNSMFGTYAFAYRNEHSDEEALRDALRDLVKRTGVERLMVGVPNIGKSYTGIEFNLTFPEENTRRLMMLAQRMSQREFVGYGTMQVGPYLRHDPYGYCDGINVGFQSCGSKLRDQTAAGMVKMHAALRKMYRYVESDPKAFAIAYGEFGQGMNENMFTFRSAVQLAGGGVQVSYLIEGTYLSMYRRSWTIDPDGVWVPADDITRTGLPFNPRTRHSMLRGVWLGNAEGGRYPHIIPVNAN